MVTNVSEKDKTLNEIIDWCTGMGQKMMNEANASGLDSLMKYIGATGAYMTVIKHCQHARLQRLHAVRGAESKRGMMSKDRDEALYEFAHWLSEKGREAREELVYKQYTPWIDDVALGRLEAYDEAYKHCREMLGNADSIFSPKFDKKTDQSEDTE